MRRSIIKHQGDALGAPRGPSSSFSLRVLKYVRHGTGFFVTSYHAGPPGNLNGFQFVSFDFCLRDTFPYTSVFFSKLVSGNGMPNSQKQKNTNAVFFADFSWVLGGTPSRRTDGTLGRFDRS